MPGVRRRAPARKERKKQKGVLLISRAINRTRGRLFETGIFHGKQGLELKNYVDSHCPPHRQ